VIRLPTFDPKSGELLSVVETPKDSRNKYAFNFEFGVFELKRVLPRGMEFPYDFGFIPSTEADDGDPLDVLLLLEDTAPQAASFAFARSACSRRANASPKGQWVRNDRLIAVAVHAKVHADLKSLKELNHRLLDEIEAFFHDYNALDGKEFEPLKRVGPSTAATLIEQAQNKKKDSDRKRAA
jgi:inorganic pyrophosphatase